MTIRKSKRRANMRFICNASWHGRQEVIADSVLSVHKSCIIVKHDPTSFHLSVSTIGSIVIVTLLIVFDLYTNNNNNNNKKTCARGSVFSNIQILVVYFVCI